MCKHFFLPYVSINTVVPITKTIYSHIINNCQLPILTNNYSYHTIFYGLQNNYRATPNSPNKP